MKKWLYHDEQDAKLYDLPDNPIAKSKQLEELYAEGWRDSPADLPANEGNMPMQSIVIIDDPRADEVKRPPVVMRAKLRLINITDKYDFGETLHFAAVVAPEYDETGNDEDNTFSKFTPTADLRMVVNNPDLQGKLPEGSVYYVDFTLAEAAPEKIEQETPPPAQTTDAPEHEATNVKEPEQEEEELSDKEEEEASALLAQFQRDPKSLTKDEHVKLGAAMGLRLMKAWNEDTLINKITEALNNGDSQATA